MFFSNFCILQKIFLNKFYIMDPFWQVAIGSGIGVAIYSVYQLYKQYLKESTANNENQTLAKWSVILGLSGIVLIFAGSIIGLILGVISMRGKKFTALSKIGIICSVLTLIPWLLVLIFGQ